MAIQLMKRCQQKNGDLDDKGYGRYGSSYIQQTIKACSPVEGLTANPTPKVPCGCPAVAEATPTQQGFCQAGDALFALLMRGLALRLCHPLETLARAWPPPSRSNVPSTQLVPTGRGAAFREHPYPDPASRQFCKGLAHRGKTPTILGAECELRCWEVRGQMVWEGDSVQGNLVGRDKE